MVENTNKGRMISTYQFYTKKNQRIAAFAELDPFDQLRIVLFMCSEKDHFSKKVGVMLYHDWIANDRALEFKMGGITIHPSVHIISPVEKGKTKTKFLDWMQRNYYRKGKERMRYTQPILHKRGEGTIRVGKGSIEPLKLGMLW